MKKIAKFLALLLTILMFGFADSRAQVIVRVPQRRPGVVIVRRPYRPSPRHVWVDEEWTPAGPRYAYRRGYWALPPHPGTVWIAGHWDHRGRGYVWVPGHWR